MFTKRKAVAARKDTAHEGRWLADHSDLIDRPLFQLEILKFLEQFSTVAENLYTSRMRVVSASLKIANRGDKAYENRSPGLGLIWFGGCKECEYVRTTLGTDQQNKCSI